MFCRTAGVRRPIVWTLLRANFTRQVSQLCLGHNRQFTLGKTRESKLKEQ
jgi:hypothetical protein